MHYKVLLRNGQLKRMATARQAQRCASYPHLIAGIWEDVHPSKIVDLAADMVTIVVDE